MPTTDLAGRRLLVTGASGFIGSRLCRRAASLGATVFAVSRHAISGRADDLCWERADLTDPDATEALMQRIRPDFVAHLAGEVSGSRDRTRVLSMLQANLVAAVNVMLAGDAAGCDRIVLAGSMEEPDSSVKDGPAQSPYAVSKWGSHAYATFLHALYQLPVVHLRVFMVYGPGQRDLRKLVPYVTSALLRGEAPQLMSGARLIDWIYVDDVVEAFLAALVAPSAAGSSFDIGAGELVSVADLVARLHRIIGADVEVVRGAIADRKLERERVADPRAARDALGWRPLIGLDDGLRRTVAFYRNADS